jgi:hypothetical protein
MIIYICIRIINWFLHNLFQLFKVLDSTNPSLPSYSNLDSACDNDFIYPKLSTFIKLIHKLLITINNLQTIQFMK